MKDVKFADLVDKIVKKWLVYSILSKANIILKSFRQRFTLLLNRIILECVLNIKVSAKWASLLRKCAFAALNDPNNDPKQTQGTTKDLDHQNFDEWVRVLGICDCATTSRNSDTDSMFDRNFTHKTNSRTRLKCLSKIERIRKTWFHQCIRLCIHWLFLARWWPWWLHRWQRPRRK